MSNKVLNLCNNSNNRNDKKVYERSTQGPFQIKILHNTIIKVASHMNPKDIKPVCPTTYGKSKTNLV